jgi:dTDP-4-dehydrorhamnose reductase
MTRIELWGGVEATVNRVGNHYLDQLQMSGHDKRSDDLERFADIGIKTLRFPILWEKVAAHSPDEMDWSWADERLELARELGIRVIVGLVHHGSGPRYTQLLDPDFAPKLARYAAAFAERYPWVDAYTPINEPLTTARFSGLYGCWYPHAGDNRSFLRMLFNECEGIRAAMKSIRLINPAAQLIQTEDLGKIFSTSFLAYQAEFENHRRWLSFDILTGRLDREHELYSFCKKHGLSDAEMDSFVRDPMPPDVIGINHYITSNRFLDERLERYPSHVHGGNRHHRYADIEAVRVGAEMIIGPKELMHEAWNRYQIPIAVTEVHLGCSREEQMRWLQEIWTSAQAAEKEGVQIKAVTAWSLLGAFDWNSLVTKQNGHYESGVYDLRSTVPRPTALVPLLKSMAKNESFDHPALDRPGWWHRPDRLLYPSVDLDHKNKSLGLKPASSSRSRHILITGASGSLGRAMTYLAEQRALDFRAISRADLELSDENALVRYVEKEKPWAIINCAGYERIDRAERDHEQCRRDNVKAALNLSSVARNLDLKFLQFSSDLVFDGRKTKAYVESDRTAALNIYGRSKVETEEFLLEEHKNSLIIRSSAFFGPWDQYNLLTEAIRTIAKGQEYFAPDDLIVSPTYLPDLVNASLDLMIDDEQGLWHLTNGGALSWVEFARMAAKRLNLKASLIVRRSASEMGYVALRPKNSALTSERAQLLPELGNALDRYIRECRVALR